MKKLIQICSLLSLVVVFSVASANAQNFGTDVEIPFSFSIGERTYEAGHYIVKVSKLTPETAKLSIEDPESGKIQTVLMTVNGESAGSEIKLVFDTYEGQKYLSRVRTKESTFAVVNAKKNKDVSQPGVAAIN